MRTLFVALAAHHGAHEHFDRLLRVLAAAHLLAIRLAQAVVLAQVVLRDSRGQVDLVAQHYKRYVRELFGLEQRLQGSV